MTSVPCTAAPLLEALPGLPCHGRGWHLSDAALELGQYSGAPVGAGGSDAAWRGLPEVARIFGSCSRGRGTAVVPLQGGLGRRGRALLRACHEGPADILAQLRMASGARRFDLPAWLGVQDGFGVRANDGPLAPIVARAWGAESKLANSGRLVHTMSG